MKKIKSLSRKALIFILAIVSLFSMCFGITIYKDNKPTVYASENTAVADETDPPFVYLSDYNYVTELNGKTEIDGKPVSYSTYDPYQETGEEIVLNGCAIKSNTDGKISLSTGGYAEDGFPNVKKYLKGITACAESVVVYDISAFDYDWFSTYYGVDSKVSFAGFFGEAPINSSICKFYFYTSVDGESWTLESEENPSEIKGYENQAFIKFSVKDKNYIKLVAVPAYANTQANHAAYGNPILFNEGFAFDDTPYDFIKTVEEYDEIINRHSYDELLSDYEDIILKRKFVSFFGYDNLQDFAHVDERHKNVIKWILHDDLDALRYFVTGGTPRAFSGASNVGEIRTKILNILYTLYTAHGEDINDTTALTYSPTFKNNATRGDLYKRMIISLSLTHVDNIVFGLCGYVPGNPPSDPLFRYETYKKFHNNGWLKNEVFERLSVPEMRQVLCIAIRDDELEWLSWYVRVKKNGNLSCHAYMPYAGQSYGNPKYFDPKYYDQWDAKYNLSEFNLSYGNKDERRLWMLYEKGGYCGNISLNGMIVQQIVGVPSVVISQYNHLAYLFQTRNADGEAAWASFYDIFGVANSAQAEGRAGSVTNWGTKGWNDTFRRTSSDLHAVQCTGSATYTHYVQYVLNDWENYVKAEEIRSLTDMYPLKFDNYYELENYTPTGENAEYSEDLIKIFNEVLKYQPKHLYGWYGLINAYREKSSTTVEDYLALAKRITENMYEHPFPMKDLLDLIEPKIKGTKYQLAFSNLITEAYKKGSVLGTEIETDYLQSNVTRALAARFLGLNQDKLEAATFSFDGANAGKIVLGKEYQNNGLSWDFSLDGVKWSSLTDKISVTLSSAQLAQITQENGIMVHFNGVDYDETNIYTIKIGKAVLPADSATNSLFANDLENRVVNVTDSYEWRYDGSDSWTSYKTAQPNLSGNRSVEVRVGAYGTNLPSDSRIFTFTEDTSTASREYISVSHISLHSVSSQAAGGHAGDAVYALDANYNTRWHSNWNGSDTQRYFSVKFDKPMFISAVEFVPAGGGNGKILDGTIYGSLDGVTWRKLAERKNLRYTNQCNTIEDAKANTQLFEIENPQDVLYIKIVADRASNGNWFTARAFNFYEDTTQEHRPAATIEFSTTDPTNGNVTAVLKNLFPDEHITITNNNGSDTYVFTENGAFTFFYVNDAGVEGKTTATVNWIDRKTPEADFDYDDTPVKDKVVVIIKPNEDVTIIRDDIKYRIDENNNVIDIEVENDPEVTDKSQAILNGYTVDEELFVVDPIGNKIANINPYRFEFTANGVYSFKYIDKAGNIGTSSLTIDFIDKSLPSAELVYDKSEPTNQNVTVTIKFNEYATLVSGSDTYTFSSNGEYTFEYRDAEDELRFITAIVTWIDKVPPTASVSYDKSNPNKAIANIIDPSEEITFADGDGTFEYTENGTYTIEFYDKAGNKGSVEVVIDWLGKDDKPNNLPLIIGITSAVAIVLLAGGIAIIIKKKRKV